jgi:hypothetical protein
MKVLYYFSIVLYFIILMCFLARYKLTVTKRIIDICQLIALVVYFRWNFSTDSKNALTILDNYNFVFANAYCNKATPPMYCTGFENLIPSAIIFCAFLIMYFLAYSVIYFR